MGDCGVFEMTDKQRMREHLAIEVMGYRYVDSHQHKGYRGDVYHRKGKAPILAINWNPFTNAEQALMVLLAFKGGLSLFRHTEGCAWQVRIRPEHLSQFPQDFGEDMNLLHAICIAAARATGYEE